jgi:gliding motility-associated-like protein
MKFVADLQTRRIFLFTFYCLFLISHLNAQQFTTQGSAVQSGPFSYTITPDALSQAGMITNYYPMDLTKNFTINFQLNFGSKDASGADGFAFMLNNACLPSLTVGSGLGVSGINNSLVVEFDTWNNGTGWNDIPQDHTGIYSNGEINASGNITDGFTTPVCITGNCNNVEDDQWHDISIQWEYISAASQRLTVFFDNEKRATSTRNHLLERFNNNAIVFWSVAGSTGGNSNLQQLRITPDNNNVINACIGKTFTLTAPAPGTNYSWSRGTSTANQAAFIVIGNETIICSYTDFCGTQRSVRFSVIANDNPTVSVNSFATCGVNPANVVATPGTAGTYNYNWTVPVGAPAPGNVAEFKPSTAGVYAVVITNTVTGCSSNAASGTVVFTPAATPLFYLPDTICKGEIINPLPTVSVNGITGTWSPVINNQATTTYTFTPDVSFCAVPATDIIDVNTPPVSLSVVSAAICAGDVKLLNPEASGNGLEFLWQDGSTDSVFRATKPGTYEVRISNSCGTGNSTFVLTQTICTIYIPSAFTPNGDGLNDLFRISGALYVKDFSMEVFNRWGQIVFTGTNAFEGWNGTQNGLALDPGIYTYRIRFTNIQNQEQRNVKGTVTLLR